MINVRCQYECNGCGFDMQGFGRCEPAGNCTDAVGWRKAVSYTHLADLFEIEPKVPYTKPDLDWMNKKSRSSVEMSDKKYRPAIMKKEMDMSSYDEILLGFPIWWYVAPTIINTFLEAYDFSGKKIVLFATSGGSGFGNTVKELQSSASDAVITEGRLLNHGTKQEISEWVNSL